MSGLRIGYVRVSALDQNPDRQIEALQVEKLYIDKASGSSTDRPQYQMMLDFIRQGDHLIVHSMDRLARNLDDLRKIVQLLVKKGVHVHFIKENLIFTGDDSPLALLTLSIMGAFSEFERSILKERQREGIEIAKKKGKYKGGKPLKLTQEQVHELKRRASIGQSKTSLGKMFSLSTRAIYNYLSNDGHNIGVVYPKIKINYSNQEINNVEKINDICISS